MYEKYIKKSPIWRKNRIQLGRRFGQPCFPNDDDVPLFFYTEYIGIKATAIGDNPYGPFTYQGVILTPVVGWTTHHAIVEYKGKWYLFHHDCVPSGGKTWLRSLKVVELEYNEDVTINTIEGGYDTFAV